MLDPNVVGAPICQSSQAKDQLEVLLLALGTPSLCPRPAIPSWGQPLRGTLQGWTP